MLLASIVTAFLLLVVVVVIYDDPLYRRVAPVAFFVHLGIGLLIIPLVSYQWDIIDFHSTAIDLLEGTPTDASEKVVAFSTFQAFLYLLFEPSVEILIVFNSLLAVLIAIPAASLTNHLYPSVNGTNAVTIFVLFLPLPAFFTSVPMRDAFVLVLTFTALALVVRCVLETSIRSATLAVPIVGLVYLVRTEIALLLVLAALGGVGTRLLARTVDRRFDWRDASVALLCATLESVLFGRYFPLETLNDQREIRSGGNAVYL
ncbi:hypothetical protein [Halostagnicola bangensis]